MFKATHTVGNWDRSWDVMLAPVKDSDGNFIAVEASDLWRLEDSIGRESAPFKVTPDGEWIHAGAPAESVKRIPGRIRQYLACAALAECSHGLTGFHG